jgi:xanthine dehydrogenase YagT iron-sulfur-binding subunit
MPCDDHSRVTRRGFLATLGAGAVGAAAIAEAQTTAPGEGSTDASAAVRILLRVNARTHRLVVEPRETLLAVLRDRLGLTAAKAGCERGECGACTVLFDGGPRYACLTLAVEAEGAEITTLEGLAPAGELSTVQQAFRDEDAFQCGFCTPGQVMAAEGLLRANPLPSAAEIRRGMSGNLCRCGAYDHIFKAVRRAAEARRSGGGR